MRLFFAIELPADAKAALAAAREALDLDPRRFRVSRDETLHLTMRFVGEVEETRAPVLARAGERAAAATRAIPCELAGIGSFPRGTRARVVWAGIADRSATGELARLASRLESEIRNAGFPPEARPHTPHVTIARARERSGGALSLPAAGGTLARFTASELLLVRSELGPGGARHEPIAAFPFLAGAR